MNRSNSATPSRRAAGAGAASFLAGSPTLEQNTTRSSVKLDNVAPKIRSYWYANERATMTSTLSPRRLVSGDGADSSSSSREGKQLSMFKSSFHAITKVLQMADQQQEHADAGNELEDSGEATPVHAPINEIFSASFVSCGINASQVLLLPIFARLKMLDLSDNPLTGLGEDGGSDSPFWLAMAPQLEILVLRGCQLRSVPPLLGANKLQVLDVSCNAIRSIDNLEPLIPTLKTLDMSFNDISSVFALRPLALLRELRTLRLHPNPVTLMPSTTTACYASLRSMLPQLNTLDGRENYSGGISLASLTVSSPSTAAGGVGSPSATAARSGRLDATFGSSSRRRSSAGPLSARKRVTASIPYVVEPPPLPPPQTMTGIQADTTGSGSDRLDDDAGEDANNNSSSVYRDARAQRYHMELLARPRPKVPEAGPELSVTINQWNGSVTRSVRRKSEVTGRKLVAHSPTRWAVINGDTMGMTVSATVLPHTYHIPRPLPASSSTTHSNNNNPSADVSVGAEHVEEEQRTEEEGATIFGNGSSVGMRLPSPTATNTARGISAGGAGGGGGVPVSPPAPHVAVPFAPPQGPGFGSSSPRNLFPSQAVTRAVTVETSFEAEQQQRRAIMSAEMGTTRGRSRSAGPNNTTSAQNASVSRSASNQSARSPSASATAGTGATASSAAYQEALAMQRLPADHSFVLQLSASTTNNARATSGGGNGHGNGERDAGSRSSRSSQFSSFTAAALKQQQQPHQGEDNRRFSSVSGASQGDKNSDSDGSGGGDGGSAAGSAAAEANAGMNDFRVLPAPSSPGTASMIIGSHPSPPLQPRTLPRSASNNVEDRHSGSDSVGSIPSFIPALASPAAGAVPLSARARTLSPSASAALSSASPAPTMSASSSRQQQLMRQQHALAQQQQHNNNQASISRARSLPGHYHTLSSSAAAMSTPVPFAATASAVASPSAAAAAPSSSAANRRSSMASAASGGAHHPPHPHQQHTTSFGRHVSSPVSASSASSAASSSAGSAPPSPPAAVLGSYQRAGSPPPSLRAASPSPVSTTPAPAVSSPPAEELVEAWLQLAKLRTLTLLSAYNRLCSLLDNFAASSSSSASVPPSPSPSLAAAASASPSAANSRREQLRLGVQGIVSQLQSVQLLPGDFLPAQTSAAHATATSDRCVSRLKAGSSRAMVAVAHEIGIPSLDVLQPKAMMAVIAAEEQQTAASTAAEGLALLLADLAASTSSTTSGAAPPTSSIEAAVERLKAAVTASSVGRFVGAVPARTPSSSP